MAVITIRYRRKLLEKGAELPTENIPPELHGVMARYMEEKEKLQKGLGE